MGFYSYKALKYSDLFVTGADIYKQCSADFYMLSAGKPFTSVSGAVGLGTSLLWRIYGSEDREVYDEIANAVTNNDPIKGGENFGIFFKSLWKTEIPSNINAGGNYRMTDGLLF